VTEELQAAYAILESAHRVLVFTGAGISTESGIPDFRGPDGLWSKVDPEDFTIRRYLANPALRAGRLSGVVTQNIDGLHQEAGIPDDHVAELHGNIRRSHCVECGEDWETAEVLSWVERGAADPHCPECGGVVKTSTVMFGESLPMNEWTTALVMAASAEALLVVGSTLGVYPAADIVLDPARNGVPMVIVNLGPTEHDHLAAVKLEGRAGTVLPELATALLG
jgi:NAD-dependent deacetylase